MTVWVPYLGILILIVLAPYVRPLNDRLIAWVFDISVDEIKRERLLAAERRKRQR